MTNNKGIFDEIYERVIAAKRLAYRMNPGREIELLVLLGYEQRNQMLARAEAAGLFQVTHDGADQQVFGVRLLIVDKRDHLEVVYA